MNEQVFQTPTWLLDKDILQRIEPAGQTERLRRFQGRGLSQLFDKDRLARVDEAESLDKSGNAFTLLDLFDGAKNSIFKELTSNQRTDAFRRNLQRAFVDQMESLMKISDNKYDQTNIKAIARGTLKSLKSEINSAAGRQSDKTSRYHLEDLVERINMILDPK